MQATTQYFGNRFSYKHGLEFHRPSKFLCPTSGRQNQGSPVHMNVSLKVRLDISVLRSPHLSPEGVSRVSSVASLATALRRLPTATLAHGRLPPVTVVPRGQPPAASSASKAARTSVRQPADASTVVEGRQPTAATPAARKR